MKTNLNFIKVEWKKSKYKTRNFGQFIYMNNPKFQIKQIQNNHKRIITSISINDENIKKKNNKLIQIDLYKKEILQKMKKNSILLIIIIIQNI